MLRVLQARALLLQLQSWMLWLLWLVMLQEPGLAALHALGMIHLSGQPPLVDPRSCPPLS